MTYSFLPFDFNQGYFNQFEVLESQKCPLVDKTKSFYIKSALSFSDFQLLHGRKAVYSLQPLWFLEIIALKLQLSITSSLLLRCKRSKDFYHLLTKLEKVQYVPHLHMAYYISTSLSKHTLEHT